MLVRWVLWTSSILFILFGLQFLFAPVQMAFFLGMDISDGVAATEIRAFYGGTQLGIGLFLGLCGRWESWRPAGTALLALTLTGMAIGRAAGLALEAHMNTTDVLLLGAEVLGILAAAAAWRLSIES